MVSAEYTLAELAAAAGMTARNVRSYRARGLIDPPTIRGRTGYYGPEHLAQLRDVQALLARGLSLDEVRTAVGHGSGELDDRARAILLSEPSPDARGEDYGRLQDSTLDLQRPGSIERLRELGIIRRSADGSLLLDAAMLARANELLADGTRVRVCADIGEVVGGAARDIADDLRGIAQAAGGRDARTYLDLATWAFRAALRYQLERPAGEAPIRPPDGPEVS
jgi:DNA-binding transcriptional MerR regulator